MYNQLTNDLYKLHNSIDNARFFKKSVGEYGALDYYAGISIKDLRLLIKKYSLDLHEISLLLSSDINEYRLLGLLFLIQLDKKAKHQNKIYFDYYLENIRFVNNWNLVDLSCHEILGNHLLHNDHELLFKFANSNNMWERRIAIVTTWRFIRNNYFKTTLDISTVLLNDAQDLIHKATGWMLRELGKRNLDMLIDFLEKNIKNMPRTTLRYSIEKMSVDKRLFYLNQ